MTATDHDLFTRLLAFPIDEGTPDLSFEARLARENGWDLDFARRVVAEYKRFVFLAMTAGHTVTPSEPVDQAWHLHLTYSRSYWERMCGELLGRPLHHGPTRGGAAESTKFYDLYTRTLASYRAAFGSVPPADVWPPVDVRFGEDLHFIRVNTVRNWVVRKAAARRAAVVASIGLATLFATGCGAVRNPFDLTGTNFVWFLVPLQVAALVTGLVLRHCLRETEARPDDDSPELDWADAAYLAGRRHRLTTAAIARLVATGVARVSSDGKWLEAAPDVPIPSDLSASEVEVVRWLPLSRERTALAGVAKQVDLQFADRATELHDAGYLLSGGRAFAARVVGVLPLAAVTSLLGGIRLVHGLQTGKPVGILGVVLFVAAVVGLVTFARSMNRLTRRGASVLKRLRANTNSTPPSDPTPDTVGVSVGLFGTAALTGCALVDLAAVATWYPHQTNGSGDGGGCGTGCGASSGGGDGGGGCGGGGCGGGCGGCGG